MEERTEKPPHLAGERSIARDMCFVGTPGGGNTCMVDVKDGKVIRIRPLRFFERYTRDEVKPWVMRARGQSFDCGDKTLPPPFSLAYKKPCIDLLTPEPTARFLEVTHERYAAQRAKDAIVDRLRARTGARPDIDVENPDVRVNLHVRKDRADIALDLGGGSLHKRGWRQDQGEAPIGASFADMRPVSCFDRTLGEADKWQDCLPDYGAIYSLAAS